MLYVINQFQPTQKPQDQTPDKTTEEKDKTPKTGDTEIINYVIMETSGLVALAIVIGVLRKKNSK